MVEKLKTWWMRMRLDTYCRRAFAMRQRPRVMNLRTITAGWENEMFAFDLLSGPPQERQREGLVLRIYPGDDAYPKSAHEFTSMLRLHAAGYPLPEVFILERERSPFGKPFVIMQFIEGQMLWPVLENASGAEQAQLFDLFCDLFVRLHSMDWHLLVDDCSPYETTNPNHFVDQWLVMAREALARYPSAGFQSLVRWIGERREGVPCEHPSAVHGDFHPGNVLLCADKTAVVIDWASFQITDSRFDLAWTLLLANAYMGQAWRDHILQAYAQRAGKSVEQIEFFEVCACARRLYDMIVTLTAGAQAQGMRPETAQIMRQQMGAFRRVYEILQSYTGISISEVEALLKSA